MNELILRFPLFKKGKIYLLCLQQIFTLDFMISIFKLIFLRANIWNMLNRWFIKTILSSDNFFFLISLNEFLALFYFGSILIPKFDLETIFVNSLRYLFHGRYCQRTSEVSMVAFAIIPKNFCWNLKWITIEMF